MALIVVGGAALSYAVTRKVEGGMAPQATEAMGVAVAQLDSDISVATTAVETRANSIAENLQVRSVVGTDVGTANDSANTALDFKAAPGDVIELGQLPKSGGPAVVLLTVPMGQAASPHDAKPGAYVELIGSKIRLTRNVAITPTDDKIAATLTGFVTVTRLLDLRPRSSACRTRPSPASSWSTARASRSARPPRPAAT